MKTDMARMTIANLGNDIDLGIVPICFVVLFSFMAYYMVWTYIKDIKRYRHMDKGSELNNVVI